jgi:hypothetical protein
MANGACGDETAARDGLNRFADDHAIQKDEVARREVSNGKFVFGGNVFGDYARMIAVAHDSSGLQRLESYEDVVAGIELQDGFGHIFLRCGGWRRRNISPQPRIQRAC